MPMSFNSDPWTMEEGFCPERGDETHCNCWWDEDICCACGHDPMMTATMEIK